MVVLLVSPCAWRWQQQSVVVPCVMSASLHLIHLRSISHAYCPTCDSSLKTDEAEKYYRGALDRFRLKDLCGLPEGDGTRRIVPVRKQGLRFFFHQFDRPIDLYGEAPAAAGN